MPLSTLESSVGNNLLQSPMGFAVHLFPDTLRLGLQGTRSEYREVCLLNIRIQKAMRLKVGVGRLECG